MFTIFAVEGVLLKDLESMLPSEGSFSFSSRSSCLYNIIIRTSNYMVCRAITELFKFSEGN